MKESESSDRAGVDRRQFLKGAAAGAAVMAAKPAVVDAQPTRSSPPTAAIPSDAQLAREEGPTSVDVSRFNEHPASDFMVDVIRSLGIDYVTTNPGSSFDAFHESLINYGGNSKPEILTCMHEESAVAMGHGYAKVEGKPLLALLHGTVGLQHASMAIFNAYADRVPVYILVGNHTEPVGDVNQYHSAQDITGLVRDFVKWDQETLSPQGFAQSAVYAYQYAMTPPMGPVCLSIDHGMQDSRLTDRSSLRVPKLSLNAPPQGDLNAIRETARLLVEAERPLIACQRSARTQTGVDLLVELAELVQAPVDVTAREGRMCFPTRHPLYGTGGEGYRPDLVLALEVHDMTPYANAVRANGGKSVSISSVALEHGSNIKDFGRYVEVALSIAADAEATLPALIESVREQLTGSRRRAIAARGQAVTKAHDGIRQQQLQEASWGWNSSPISLARLSAELWAQIKNDDFSLLSPQTFVSGWPSKLWDMHRHYHHIGLQGGGGMGYGAPAAVGAALANKRHGRLSINIQCDGDLNYAPGVLWTAVHHQIPMLNIMHNNRAYHAEVMILQRKISQRRRGENNSHIGTTITNPNIDYATMARSYGMYSEGPIEDPNELAPAIARGLARVRAGEPVLIDTITQPR
jgi:acetolactate synthase-1/2/3 large subunit